MYDLSHIWVLLSHLGLISDPSISPGFIYLTPLSHLPSYYLLYSVKSNDQKAALTIDTARVQHQVQYLGLSENIKVRRAGYAYRNEYHRFLERFAILSDKTYPEWSGSDLVRGLFLLNP